MNGASAWQTLFTELISGLKFPIEHDGEHEASPGGLQALIRDPDRSIIRQRAHESQYAVLRQHDHVLAYVYNTLVQDKHTLERLRHFPNAMASRHLSNDVDPAVIDTMLNAVEAHAGLAQQYFQLKAKLLGLPKLAIFDQYANRPNVDL